MMFTSQLERYIAVITLLCFAASSVAAPQAYGYTDYNNGLSNVQVPLSNGTASLPAPTGKLVTVVLGLGTQNYTCNATTPAPVPVGAKARLFNLTPFFPWIEPFLAQIPGRALAIDINTVTSALDQLGNHIFNDAGTPTFNLGQVGNMLAAKVPGADLVAPAPGGDAKPGVDWLKLADKGGSTGVNQVYRVNTAGGKPPKTCDGQGSDITSPYAALYWFYEG